MTETIDLGECRRVAIAQTQGIIARLQSGREDADGLLRAALGNARNLDDDAVAMLEAALKAYHRGNDVSATSFAKVALERLTAGA